MREHLDIGRVFSAVAELYRNNVGPLLGSALVIFLVAAVLTALLLAVSPLLFILTLPVLFVAQFWYQGMVIELVNRVHAGTGVPGIGELFSAVGPALGRLIVAGLLAGLGIAVGLVLLIAPGLYLATIWAVIAPVVVVERLTVGRSFRRSQQLVAGDGWQVFGVIVILIVVNAVIGLLIRAVAGDSFVGVLIGSLIPNLLLAPLSALAAAVVYFELRRLKERPGVGGAPAPTGVPAGAPPPGGPPPRAPSLGAPPSGAPHR